MRDNSAGLGCAVPPWRADTRWNHPRRPSSVNSRALFRPRRVESLGAGEDGLFRAVPLVVGLDRTGEGTHDSKASRTATRTPPCAASAAVRRWGRPPPSRSTSGFGWSRSGSAGERCPMVGRSPPIVEDQTATTLHDPPHNVDGHADDPPEVVFGSRARDISVRARVIGRFQQTLGTRAVSGRQRQPQRERRALSPTR